MSVSTAKIILMIAALLFGDFRSRRTPAFRRKSLAALGNYFCYLRESPLNERADVVKRLLAFRQ